MNSWLEALARRPPWLYGHYRAACVAADALDAAGRRAVCEERRARMARGAAGRPAITTREAVRSAPQRYLHRTWWPVVGAATGGTTGVPLRLERSYNQIVFEQATIDHVVAGFGIDLTSARVAVFRGADIKSPDDHDPPFWIDRGARTRIFSSNHLSPRHAGAIMAGLRRFAPDMLFCYPSTLAALVALQGEGGAPIAPRLAITSSESPPPGLHAAVLSAFGCPLLDYYGQAERVAFASSDGAGRYRFRWDYGDVRLTVPARRGIVVASGLHNRRQRLVDYDTGDAVGGAAGLSDAALDAVALGLADFDGIEGRIDEVMALADGRRIVGFNQLARGIDYVRSVQFVRCGPTALEIVVVPDGGSRDVIRAQLTAKLRRKLPSNLTLDWRFVDGPVRTATGKAPVYIDATR